MLLLLSNRICFYYKSQKQNKNSKQVIYFCKLILWGIEDAYFLHEHVHNFKKRFPQNILTIHSHQQRSWWNSRGFLYKLLISYQDSMKSTFFHLLLLFKFYLYFTFEYKAHLLLVGVCVFFKTKMTFIRKKSLNFTHSPWSTRREFNNMQFNPVPSSPKELGGIFIFFM